MFHIATMDPSRLVLCVVALTLMGNVVGKKVMSHCDILEFLRSAIAETPIICINQQHLCILYGAVPSSGLKNTTHIEIVIGGQVREISASSTQHMHNP
jgi:hypothetical protein